MPELREPTNLAGFDRRSLETAFERIKTLMGEDPKSFLPRDDQLRSLHEEILLNTKLAVKTWLAATNHSQPQFRKAVGNSDPFYLLRRIFGTGIEDELLSKIARIFIQPPVSVRTVLWALIGRAVHEWVFEVFQPSLQSQPSGRWSSLLQLLSRVSPMVREQFDSISTYEYVQTTEELDPHVGELAERLGYVLKAFYPGNTKSWSKEILDAWWKYRRGIFNAAIRLKYYTCLQPDAFFFRWPQMEEAFDSRWMQGDVENPTDCSSPVCLALFPALFRGEEALAMDQGQTELPVFPAVVLQRAP